MTLQMDDKMRASFDRLPKYLRSLRERCNFTQQTAADFAGVTQAAVAYIERGKRTPSLDTLCCLLEVYGSSLQLLAVDLNL